MTSSVSMSPKPQTASAASRSKLSANTDRRRSSSCSAPVEQRIGPVDGRLQGLLPRQGGAASPGQQAEPLVEAVVQGAERQRAQPGGGQLDGQRQPVQPRADRHHQRGGLLVERQAGALRPGPVDEQRDRIGGLGRRKPVSPGPGSDSGGTR